MTYKSVTHDLQKYDPTVTPAIEVGVVNPPKAQIWLDLGLVVTMPSEISWHLIGGSRGLLHIVQGAQDSPI